MLGSCPFGVGRGLSCFYLGPAVAALSLGRLPVFVFVVVMLLGMAAHRVFAAQRQKPVHGTH